LHCYRRSEIQQVAERVCALSNEESSEHSAIAFVSGLGLYHQTWMQKLRQSLRDWMSTLQSVPLNDVVAEIKRQQAVLQNCEDAVIETLLGLWPEVRIQRSSIFDATVELVNENVIMKNDELREAVAVPEGSALQPTKLVKKQVREKRVGAKRHSIGEMDVVQGSLWN
jgi:hypothetical protein